MSTLLHRLVLSIELGIVQTGTGKVDPARKFKCTTAARAGQAVQYKYKAKRDCTPNELSPSSESGVDIDKNAFDIYHLYSEKFINFN